MTNCHHASGSITALEFAAKSHLLSAAEDGLLTIWKCKSWECMKNFKGHKYDTYLDINYYNYRHCDNITINHYISPKICYQLPSCSSLKYHGYDCIKR